MNDPRETAIFPEFSVEGFGVNDERALRNEVDEHTKRLDWEHQADDARAAMAALVREALLAMAEDVDAWLPSAAVARTGKSFGFFVWWKNGHLDEEIINQRTRAEREVQDRLGELERLAGRTT